MVILSEPIATALLSSSRYLDSLVEFSVMVFMVYPFTSISVAETAVPAVTDGEAAVVPIVPSP